MHGNWCVHMYIPLMAVCLYHIVVLVSKVVDSFNYGAVNFLDLCKKCLNYKGHLLKMKQNSGHIERLIESSSHA